MQQTNENVSHSGTVHWDSDDMIRGLEDEELLGAEVMREVSDTQRISPRYK